MDSETNETIFIQHYSTIDPPELHKLCLPFGHSDIYRISSVLQQRNKNAMSREEIFPTNVTGKPSSVSGMLTFHWKPTTTGVFVV